MSHASYAVYQFTDSFEVSEALSDALIAIELKEDDKLNFSQEELDEMLESGEDVLDSLIAYFDDDYDGENTIIAELANRLVTKEYSQKEARKEVIQGRKHLYKENWDELREILLEIQELTEKISDRKYENAVFV